MPDQGVTPDADNGCVAVDQPWLEQRWRLAAHSTALIGDQEAWSWDRLRSESLHLAGALSARGLGRGDRVATVLPASVQFVALVHALQYLGAVLVPLNRRESDDALADIISRVDPTFVIVDDHAPSSNQLQVRIASTLTLDELADATTPPAALRDGFDADALHSILFTSGTDGTPKGVRLSARNHHAGALAACRRLRITPADRWIAAMPLNHVGGLSILLRSAISGFPVILQAAFDAASFDAGVRQHGATVASVVPTMLVRWLALLESKPPPPSLRCALVGGAAAAPELLKRAARLGIATASTYGLTETAAQVATSNVGGAIVPEGNSGRALAGVSIEIDDNSTGVGEIIVTGEQVMIGYLDEAPLNDHRLATGDLGRVDADGHLFVLGRRDDMIVSGGENVAPARVEAILIKNATVAEAGVFAIPDPQWGEIVAAALVAVPGESVDTTVMRQACERHLAPHERPKRYFTVDALPRTSSGKLKRKSLREKVEI